jgi:hypothetical protein
VLWLETWQRARLAAPAVLVGGAVLGAMTMGGNARRQADAIVHSVKDNEQNMRESFEGVIGGLALRYDTQEEVASIANGALRESMGHSWC